MPSNETANERFERLAEAFYRETGLMAPGKDDPLGHHDYDTRIARWKEWLAAQSSPSPASAEMPEDVEITVRGVRYWRTDGRWCRRKDDGTWRLIGLDVPTLDEIARLTRELSESRARADNAEIDHAASERRARGYERRLAWINEQLQRGVGPVTFSLTENGTIGVWGPEASRDDTAGCDGSGDTADEAIASARRHTPTESTTRSDSDE